MGKQYEMAFQIGAKVQGSFGSAFKSAATSVQSLQTTINELNKKQSDISSYQKTQEALERTRQKLQLYQQQYANMKAAIEGNENATYQEQNAMLAKAKAIDDLKAKQEQLENKLKTTGEALQEEGVDLDNLGQASQEAKEDVEALRQEQEELSASSGSAANCIMELVGALGAMEALKAVGQAFKECAEQAIAFESSMAAVKRTVGGDDAFLNQLGEDFKKLSTQIPMTTEELTQIATTAGQLGIEQSKVEQFTEVMAKLATTTDLTADEAATMLAQFANITGLTDYERLGSVVAQLGDATATTASKVVQMSQGMAASASIAGFSETDIMALAAAVGSLGIEAQAGSTSMSQLISTLYKATETGENLENFAAVAGMSAEQFKKSWGEDAIGTMNRFIQGLNDTERNGRSAVVILDELGITNVRQTKAILGLANAGDLLTNTITQANDAWAQNTALNEKAGIMYETTEAKLTMMQNAANNVKVAIGDAFTPVIGAAADALTGLLEPVAEFIEANPALVQGIGAALAVMGGLTGAVVAYSAAAKIAAAASAALTAAIPGAKLLLGIGAAIAVVTGAAVALSQAFKDSSKSMAEMDAEFDSLMDQYQQQQAVIDLCEQYRTLSSEMEHAVDTSKKMEGFEDIEIDLKGKPEEDVRPKDFLVGGDDTTKLTGEADQNELLNGVDFIVEGTDTIELTPEADDSTLIDGAEFVEDGTDVIPLTAEADENGLVDGSEFIEAGTDTVDLTGEVGPDGTVDGSEFVEAGTDTVDLKGKAENKLNAEKDFMEDTGVKIKAEADGSVKLDANVFVKNKNVKFKAEWENKAAMLQDVEKFKQQAADAKKNLEDAQNNLAELKDRQSQIEARIWNSNNTEDLPKLQQQMSDVTEAIIEQEAQVGQLETAYTNIAAQYVITAQAIDTLHEKDDELKKLEDELTELANQSADAFAKEAGSILDVAAAQEELARAKMAQIKADIYANTQEQAKSYASTMREAAEYQELFNQSVEEAEVVNRYAGMSVDDISDSYRGLLQTLDDMEDAEGFTPDTEAYKVAVAEANALYNVLTGMPDDWSQYADGFTNWVDSFAYVAGNAENWNQIVADINQDVATYGSLIAGASENTTMFLDNLVNGVSIGAVSIGEVETLLTTAFANEENGAELLAEAMEYVRARTQEAADAQEELATAQEEGVDTQAVIDATQPIIEKMNELAKSYKAAYDAAYQSISGQFELFEKVSLDKESDAAKTSVDDMINSLKSQSDYMTEYAVNLQKASQMGISDGLLAQLSDGSTESAQYLQEIVTNGSAKIDELNEAFASVEQGKAKFADTVAEMQTDFSASMKQLETDLQTTVDTMDKSAESAASGQRTVKSYAEGALSQLSAVQDAFAQLSAVAQIKAKVSFSLGGLSFGGGKGGFSIGSFLGIPGFAGGTDSAPEGWAWVGEHGPELMHLQGGEQILNAQESRTVSADYAASSGGSGGYTIEYKPQYTINGSMNADDLYAVLEEHDQQMRGQLEDLINDIAEDRARRAYA